LDSIDRCGSRGVLFVHLLRHAAPISLRNWIASTTAASAACRRWHLRSPTPSHVWPTNRCASYLSVWG